MVWGGRREEGSGWGTHVYLWQIHFDIWQNQYNIVKLNKIKLKKKKEEQHTEMATEGWIGCYRLNDQKCGRRTLQMEDREQGSEAAKLGL